VDSTGKSLSSSDAAYVYLECQFNPEEIKVNKKYNWTEHKIPFMNQPDLDPGGGDAATFDLKLMFDTTGEDKGSARDVRKHTDLLFRLVMMWGNDPTTRPPPPKVKFVWGGFQLFLAIVTEVDVNYILFDADGTPVRADATIKCKQWDVEDDPAKPQNPTSRTESRRTRVVRMGERLDHIAYEEYGHVSHWRYLAEVNKLQDPRLLQPGQILLVPPLA
jgi:hypothetical protein